MSLDRPEPKDRPSAEEVRSLALELAAELPLSVHRVTIANQGASLSSAAGFCSAAERALRTLGCSAAGSDVGASDLMPGDTCFRYRARVQGSSVLAPDWPGNKDKVRNTKQQSNYGFIFSVKEPSQLTMFQKS